MFEKEIIEFFHKHYNEIEGIIDQIIDFHSKIDDKYYEIQNIESVYGGFNVHVGNYIKGWGNEYFDKFIDLSMFYDQDQYDDLQSKAEESVTERERLKKQIGDLELKKKLEEAKKFLEQHNQI